MFGDCTAAEVTTMTECTAKIQKDMAAADTADMEKLCGIYQSMNECYPACYCKNGPLNEAITASNKKTTDALAGMNVECPLTCGVGAPPATLATLGAARR